MEFSFRDQEFVKFHLSLGRGLYCTDLDCVEWRVENGKPRIAALVEVKFSDDGAPAQMSRHSRQLRVLTDLARKAEVPLFLVTYRAPVEKQRPIYKPSPAPPGTPEGMTGEWQEVIGLPDKPVPTFPVDGGEADYSAWEVHIQPCFIHQSQMGNPIWQKWITGEDYKAFLWSL